MSTTTEAPEKVSERVTDEEARKQILAAIRERMGPDDRPCPMCGHSRWVLPEGIAIVIYQAEYGPMRTPGAGSAMPFAVLICEHCGNAQFFNLYGLGLGHLLEERPEPK